MPSPWFPIIILVVFGGTFAALTRRVTRRIGRSPNTFGSGDTAHDFIGRVYRVGGAILFAIMAARALAPGIDAMIGTMVIKTVPLVAWGGIAAMIAGSTIIIVAQWQMGTSWRIGLDCERTELATSGLFTLTRNPTFLGMLAVVAGASLTAPGIVTGMVLAAAWVAFSIQVRMEEEHLARMHGGDYEAYRAAVPRWIGVARGFTSGASANT